MAITPVRPANQAEQVIIGMDLEYLGLVSSGDRQEAMFNSIYGAVSGEVGQQLPGTDITLQSADDQKAVFTMKGMKYTVFLNVPESHSAP